MEWPPFPRWNALPHPSIAFVRGSPCTRFFVGSYVGLLGGIVILVVLRVGALAYSGLSQRMTLASTRVDTERGIEPLEKVVLGGLEQSIYLRVNLLRNRFRVEKIHLLGHSWGSVLGAITAQ